MNCKFSPHSLHGFICPLPSMSFPLSIDSIAYFCHSVKNYFPRLFHEDYRLTSCSMSGAIKACAEVSRSTASRFNFLCVLALIRMVKRGSCARLVFPLVSIVAL